MKRWATIHYLVQKELMFALDETGEIVKEVRAACTPRAVRGLVVQLEFDGYRVDWDHSTINKPEGLL